MEFIEYDETLKVLEGLGISREEENDCLRFTLDPEEGEAIHLHLTTGESEAEPRPDARVMTISKDRLPDTLEHILHRLHLAQTLIIPIGKWRKVFDAVAFSLATNEEWQEIDAAASVRLNRRDPLLCGPGDTHTLVALVRALLSDAETPDQGFTITTTATPLLIELVPDGTARITVESDAIADVIGQTVPA